MAEELAAAQGSSQVALVLANAGLLVRRIPATQRSSNTACFAPHAPGHPGKQVVLEGEGDLVNLDVTSPAATVALGLMYLQTGDATAAAAFALPGTRPHMLVHGVFSSTAKLAANIDSAVHCRHTFRAGLRAP